MARKVQPPVRYDDELAIPATTTAAAPPAAPSAQPVPEYAPEAQAEAVADAPLGSDLPAASGSRRPIIDKSAPTLVYIHPQGKHQLRQYAVAQGLRVKVHDLLIEALEEWGAKRGLPGPWRVPPAKPRR
jgi:hypothetical protein